LAEQVTFSHSADSTSSCYKIVVHKHILKFRNFVCLRAFEYKIKHVGWHPMYIIAAGRNAGQDKPPEAHAPF